MILIEGSSTHGSKYIQTFEMWLLNCIIANEAFFRGEVASDAIQQIKHNLDENNNDESSELPPEKCLMLVGNKTTEEKLFHFSQCFRSSFPSERKSL